MRGCWGLLGLTYNEGTVIQSIGYWASRVYGGEALFSMLTPHPGPPPSWLPFFRAAGRRQACSQARAGELPRARRRGSVRAMVRKNMIDLYTCKGCTFIYVGIHMYRGPNTKYYIFLSMHLYPNNCRHFLRCV